MSDRDPTHKTKDRSTADFWRACRYLYPHRRIVVVSILAAFVVGGAFTTGLSTMLPILRVLIYGDTVQAWMDRQIVEERLDVRLAEEKDAVRIVSTKDDGTAARAGLRAGDEIVLAVPEGAAAAPPPPGEALTALVDGSSQAMTVHTAEGRQVRATLDPVPWHLRWGHSLAHRLPLDPVWSIGVVFGVLAGLAIFGNIVRFFQEYLGEKAAILAVEDMRRHTYDHVLHMPLGYFSLKGTSDVTSRLVQDAGQLQEGFKAILGRAVQEPIKAAMSFGLALFFSWRLTLFIVIFAPIVVVLIQKFGKKMRRASKRMLQSYSSVLGQLEGSLIGIRVVKGAAAERYERRRYKGVMREVVRQQMKLSKVDAMSSPVIESLMLLMVGAIMLYAAWLVLKAGTLNPGHFIMVMACLAGMADSLRKTTKVNNVLQKSNAAAARIFELHEVPVERRRGAVGTTPPAKASGPRDVDTGRPASAGRREGTGAVKLAPLAREISFDNVTFTYPGASTPAIRNIDLTVKKGTSVAIVGRNGSGKTTLLALLPRFYDVDSGRILIDGVDVRDATLRSLRKQIGIVTQDSVIFPGTIEQNIAYGEHLPDPVKFPKSRADIRQRVEAAARRAFANDFIMEKADGYDTVLGEHGAQLSGGQKQRICIARAIYRQTPIMILDEATSQIDADSEHLIQQAIEDLMHERTTFVIAHRFSTILSADQIVVIDRGQVVGMGKHDDLLATCPVYRQLYDRQIFTPTVSTATDTLAPSA